MPEEIVYKGLEGVVIGTSENSKIDGQEGTLIYRGYPIEDLGENATFEEVAYLLWYKKLPNAKELAEFKTHLDDNRQLPREMYDLIKLMPKGTNPMAMLRTCISFLSGYDNVSGYFDRESIIRKGISVTAKIPTMIAAYDRIRKGKQPVSPKHDLDFAANFLAMLHSHVPKDIEAKSLDCYLVLLADHGCNASTFAARVTASTNSDYYSAICSAIGALKGPLHGAANRYTMEMLLEIGDVDNAEAYIEKALSNKERVMGFGHRVYKVRDPRANPLQKMAKELAKETKTTKWYDLSLLVEKLMKDKKDIDCNVDFYSATVLYALGIDVDLFTTLFAMSRMVGWTAQLLEQYENNRLIRPRLQYVGPVDQKWVPIEKRD